MLNFAIKKFHFKIYSKLLLLIFFASGIFYINSESFAAGYLYKYSIPDLDLIYIGQDLSYIIPYTARCFVNAYNFHKKFWDYNEKEKVRIIFNDFNDIGNGGATVTPWKLVFIGVESFDYSLDVVPANERMQWLMEHELTHIIMADKPSPGDKFYRSIFGGNVPTNPENPLTMIYSYLAEPRWYSPRWYHEGIACFMETWLSGGLGRALGNYDEMAFRTMVYDNAYFYNVVGLETEGTTADFQVGVNSYLYGTRFVTYLAYKFGIDKLKQFFERTSESSAYYANQFKNVYGNGIEEEWENWIRWEKDFQNDNLKKIREYPITEYRQITEKPLGSVSQSFFDKKSKRLISAVNYPGDMAHIEAINIDNGKRERIGEVPSPGLFYVTSMTYDDSNSILYVSTNNAAWRGLHSFDLNTGKEKQLIEYTRTGDLAFDNADKSVWGIQHQSGRTILVRIPPPFNHIDRVWTVDYGKSLFSLNISKDGKYLTATMSDAAGKQKLVFAKTEDLILGKYDFTEIYEFEDNTAMNFVFSDDGKYLYGTSYYTGVSNIYRISLETKKSEILTNAETGYFRPIPIDGDSIIAFQYRQNGLLPVILKTKPLENVNAIKFLGQLVSEKDPEVRSIVLQPPSKINLDSIQPVEEAYNSFANIKMSSAYPIVQGYKSFVSYGYEFNLQDLMGINRCTADISYSPNNFLPKKERIHGGFDYNYWDWNFKAEYNQTDFYDLFGPTKRSRAGYFFSLKYKNYLIFNQKPKECDFYIYAATYGDLQTLPDYQNVAATFDKLHVLAVNFHYAYLRKSLGALEPEQGIVLNVYSFNSYVQNKFIPKFYADFDAGLLLPLRNSSLWLRTSAGNSFGDTSNSFSYFYFGGFGNNYIDRYAAQRYRETESFPGLAINGVGGTNYAKALLEWNLTPLRFKKLGFLSFYSTYARLSFFGSGLALDIDKNEQRRILYSYGLQLDFELVLFSLFKSTLSFGYGITIEKGIMPAKEFMVSLKIL